VLLDALLVRVLLVPALTVDLGRVIWWPGPLSHRDPALPRPGADAGAKPTGHD
jgi:RND superfamily putative drug exporter